MKKVMLVATCAIFALGTVVAQNDKKAEPAKKDEAKKEAPAKKEEAKKAEPAKKDEGKKAEKKEEKAAEKK